MQAGVKEIVPRGWGVPGGAADEEHLSAPRADDQTPVVKLQKASPFDVVGRRNRQGDDAVVLGFPLEVELHRRQVVRILVELLRPQGWRACDRRESQQHDQFLLEVHCQEYSSTRFVVPIRIPSGRRSSKASSLPSAKPQIGLDIPCRISRREAHRPHQMSCGSVHLHLRSIFDADTHELVAEGRLLQRIHVVAQEPIGRRAPALLGRPGHVAGCQHRERPTVGQDADVAVEGLDESTALDVPVPRDVEK